MVGRANNQELASDAGAFERLAQIVKPFFRNKSADRDDIFLFLEAISSEDVIACTVLPFKCVQVRCAVWNARYPGCRPREALLQTRREALRHDDHPVS